MNRPNQNRLGTHRRSLKEALDSQIYPFADVVVTKGLIYKKHPFVPLRGEAIDENILSRLSNAIEEDLDEIRLAQYGPSFVKNVALADLKKKGNYIETTLRLTLDESCNNLDDYEYENALWEITDFIEGQCSDGWGEGFGQMPFMESNQGQLFFYPYNGGSRVTTEGF